MRFSAALAVFSLFAASASASVTPLLRRQSPPACELPCVTNPNLGGCKAGDNTCLCNNDVFVQSTFQCIQAACTGQDLHDAIAGAAALCAAVHVTLVSAAGAEFSATASLGSSPAAATTPASNTAAATSPPASPSPTTNGALSSSANALLGLAAIGAVALAL